MKLEVNVVWLVWPNLTLSCQKKFRRNICSDKFLLLLFNGQILAHYLMAKVNQDLLQKFQKASLAPKRQEADGHEIQACIQLHYSNIIKHWCLTICYSELQVEVREDEEQSIKLQEIIDLLVAAGYFRARIKGLSPFDKVVGGMTWCIESLNVDIDVDLLFQENSTIGQKM